MKYSHWLSTHINLDESKYTIKGLIIKSNSKYAIIENNKQNVLFFTNNFVSPTELRDGDQIEAQGKILDIKNTKYNDYKYWILSNNIQYFLDDPQVNIVTKPQFSLKNKILKYSSQPYQYFNKYWKTIVFGYQSNEMTQKFIKLNIVHLIVISGFHIDIIFFMFFKINKKNNKWVNGIFFFFVFWYITLLNSYISALRVFIIYVFHKQFKFKYIESWIISMAIIFLFNFNNVFNIGFIFSFSISLFVYLISKIKIKKKMNKFWNFFLKLFLIYVFTIPLIIQANAQINLLGFIYSILFIPIVELIYIVSILFWFSPISLNYIFYVFDQLIFLSLKGSYLINVPFDNWLFVHMWILSANLLLVEKIIEKQRYAVFGHTNMNWRAREESNP